MKTDFSVKHSRSISKQYSRLDFKSVMKEEFKHVFFPHLIELTEPAYCSYELMIKPLRVETREKITEQSLSVCSQLS